MPNLAGKVCLVTGASRGIGKGIALQLITYGATCYITGRDISKLKLVKLEAESRGCTGKCIPVQCDHSNDEDVENLFKKISDDQNGNLDLLVNNAYAGIAYILENNLKNFWDQSLAGYDVFSDVGLRSNFVCAVFASRLMVAKRKGLIVNISSFGALTYFETPAYGIGKAGTDRMVKDCAVDLEQYNVAIVSLWPGPARTELCGDYRKTDAENSLGKPLMNWMFDHGETIEFSGKCIAHLMSDPNIMKKSGQVILTTDIAQQFNFKDVDGGSPVAVRSFKSICASSGMFNLSCYIPAWLRMPLWLFKLVIQSIKPNPQTKEPSKYA